MEFLLTISPLIFWLAITGAIIWILLKAINSLKPKKDLERRIEILEEEIRILKNKK